MEIADLATHVRQLESGRQSRRAVVGRLGFGGLAAGLLSTAATGAVSARSWEDLSPDAAAPVAPMAGIPPLEGVSGGWPPFAYPLEASTPVEYAAGAVRWATSEQLPTLQGVSMASLRLAPGGMRELHWHLNAHELNVCLAGAGRIGIFAPDGTSETIDIVPGSITFIPDGYTHYIQNTGADELHLVIAFTNDHLETTDFSQALPVLPTPLLAQVFGVAANDFPFLTTRGDRVLVPLAAPEEEGAPGTPVADAASAYSVNVDQLPVSAFTGGTVQPLTDQQIPKLEAVTVFPLTAVPYGLREPHWHPNAAELNYCVSGQAQIGIVAPDGNVQTFAVNAGDIAYIPRNWFHYIANTGDEPLQFLIFFITPDARIQTINLSLTVDHVPASVLAASFDSDPDVFAALPKRGNVGIVPPVGME
jgi:oxalate decarboxylase